MSFPMQHPSKTAQQAITQDRVDCVLYCDELLLFFSWSLIFLLKCPILRITLLNWVSSPPQYVLFRLMYSSHDLWNGIFIIWPLRIISKGERERLSSQNLKSHFHYCFWLCSAEVLAGVTNRFSFLLNLILVVSFLQKPLKTLPNHA
jgi:hypothetical protein